MSEEESFANEEAKSLFREYIKHEMKAADSMQELANKYDKRVINDSAEEVFKEVHDNLESDMRKGVLYQNLLQVGKAIGSESMVQSGKEMIEQLREGME